MTRSVLGLMIALVLSLTTFVFYGDLPPPPSAEEVVFEGEAVGGLHAGLGAFLGPLLIFGLWLVLWFFPRVDPWGEGSMRGGKTYWIVGNLVLLVMGTIHLMVLGVTLGWPVEPAWLVVVIPGLFLLAVGSYLPTVPAGWPLGVRTPWTLRDEGVWHATHRLAGKTFVAGGLILIGGIFLSVEDRLLLALIGFSIAGGIPAIYSLILSRRARG